MMQVLTRHTLRLFTLIIFMLVSPWSLAETASNETVTPADPTYVIKTTLEKITAFSSSSNNVNPLKLRDFIENQIIPHFDFDNMSHWITGRYARNMSESDKSDFQRNLRETFLTSLSKHLGSFDAKNTRVRFYPARYRGPAEAFASATVYRPDSMPVRLDFRMRREGNDWKIIDVKANGSSAIIYYRRHFIAQLRQYQRQYRTQNRYLQR